MFIKERCEVAGRGEMGLGTNLGFPYLELSLHHHKLTHSPVCASLLSHCCNMQHAS